MSKTSAYTILAPGFAKWWGSDARALAQVFRNLGHAVLDIDEEDYVSWRAQGFKSKVVRRLFSGAGVDDYNETILKQAESSAFDFVLAFKGNLLKTETVRRLGEFEKPIYNFYPDVSFADHGPNIPATLGLYDCVFTTKSYHGEREIKRFGIRELRHVRHGFDPEVHRPIDVSPEIRAKYECDVSFIGCWSPEKEERLRFILQHLPNVLVKVYGLGWHYASNEFRQRLGQNLKPGVFGDELSIAYGASRINLGLLSCAKSDHTQRDQTTARTFQIPATRSFMLHEDTQEVRSLFENGREVMLFASNEELIDKIKLALQSPELRKSIQDDGFERCQRDGYDYSSAAQEVVAYFSASKNRNDSEVRTQDAKSLLGSDQEVIAV